MKVPVEIEVKVKRTLPQDKNILLVRVRRDKKGLKVYLKSSCLEEYFSQLSVGKLNTESPWCGHKSYRGNDSRLPTNMAQSLREGNWHGGITYVYEGPNTQYNCSMLRAVGLRDGVNFLWQGLFPATIVTEWLHQLQNIAMHIYVLYLKPKEQSITLSIKETLDEGTSSPKAK